MSGELLLQLLRVIDDCQLDVLAPLLATAKNDVSFHDRTAEEAVELLANKLLCRMLAESGAMH